MEIAKDGNSYYSFIINHSGTITRNIYGNSLLNTPVTKNLGSLGLIKNQAEGIDIINENGNWYGFITCGGI